MKEMTFTPSELNDLLVSQWQKGFQQADADWREKIQAIIEVLKDESLRNNYWTVDTLNELLEGEK